MRTLLGIVLLLIVLALIGWVSFDWGPSESSLNVETQQIKEDVSEMSQSAEELGERMRQNVDEEAEQDLESDADAESAPVK